MILGYMIVSNRVAKDRMRVGYLYRTQPMDGGDSGWRVFSGEESQDYADQPDNFALYNASTIIGIDPSIEPLLGNAAPIAFERNEDGVFVEVEDFVDDDT